MTNKEAHDVIATLLNCYKVVYDNSCKGVFCRDCKYNISKEQVLEALEMALKSMEPSDWIPCSEKMPEEKDSMFAKFYGTDKWREAMMRKRSDRVLVTVEYEGCERTTDVASTNDGVWQNSISVIKRKVIAWKPLPEPYRG